MLSIFASLPSTTARASWRRPKPASNWPPRQGKRKWETVYAAIAAWGKCFMQRRASMVVRKGATWCNAACFAIV
jgi:hypothetical protein